MLKRTISLILVLVMVLGMMPMQAFATEETEAVEVVTEPTEAAEVPEEETTAPTEETEVTEFSDEEEGKEDPLDEEEKIESSEPSEPVEEADVIHEHDYAAVETKPTCTEQGYTTYTCNCGHSYADDYAETIGHTYESGICSVCETKHPGLEQYEGKVISVLGDSISTFAGYIPVADGFNLAHRARYPQDNLLMDVNETWWMQVLDILDAKLGINDSWAGSRVANNMVGNSGDYGEKAAMASVTRIQNLGANGTPDVILFYGGTNDIAHTLPMGSFSPENAPTGANLTATKWNSAADAYVAAILRMRYFYPNAQILAMLPTYTVGHYSDAKLEAFNALLASICEHYNVAYIDLRDCGITTADLPDGIHPDSTGMDYITEAVVGALLEKFTPSAGENVVYSVTHNLTGAESSLGYYKGVSHGRPFATQLIGENLEVTVTMGGDDVTRTVYENGVVTIESVTGDLVITAAGREKTIYEDHLQQLPENVCKSVNLWEELVPENLYYTSGGWGNLPTNAAWSITIPVSAGDQIYASAFRKYGDNGNNYSTDNGIRVTYFDTKSVLKAMSPNETYNAFKENGYLTAPENAVAMNIPMWTNSNANEVFVLNRDHTYENGVCTGCGANAPVIAKPMSMKYDDHLDMTGKVVEILDEGVPTSYQVGYGVEENKVRDTAVVTLKGNTLVATGIGTAMVKIDGETYEITVTAAPISLLLLAGQSNMQGSEGDENQSIVCPDGMVYSTYGDRYTMTTSNATNFAPSALTGSGSDVNVNGSTTNLEEWPIYLLNERGVGKKGPDSGFAYEWVKQTGEKVWVVNAAHGGSSINTWQKTGENYKEALALFTACQETLRKEIAAGHYTLSHMGYFWCQGCTDYGQTAEWYVNKYLTMHENFKSQMAFDHDSNSSTDAYAFEFGGIIPVRAGNESYTSYRQGIYSDSTTKKYYESFKDLRFTGPRVAQYWMTNNPDLPDIWNVCNIGEDWVWMPDGTNGVTEYFQSHYPNGTVDYTTQVQQSVSWYTPTTPAAVHDSIHYNQIGYNEVGREAARNALIMLGEIEAPEVETSVQFLSWDGYTEVTEINASTAGSSGTLVVPKVYPVWESKNVTYAVTEGLSYKYYDLLSNSPLNGGTLNAEGFDVSVSVVARELSSYSWELQNGVLISSGNTENAITRVTGTTENNLFLDTQYRLEKPFVLLHDQNWVLEWKMTGPWYGASTTSQKIFCEDAGSATPGAMCLLIKGNENRITIGYYGTTTHISYGLDLDNYGISVTDSHVYRLANHINDDGSNTIYLFVDGKQIAPMTHYFTGTSGAMGEESDYLSGKDISFGYLGAPKYLLNNGVIEYISVVESGASSDIHFHDWSDWKTVKVPDKDGPGEQNRTCHGCGEMEMRIVTSIWQTTNILKHWNELPDTVCSNLNLWAVLEHDPKYYVNSKGDWDYHSSKNVPSVTFAVNPGDQIYATSFGAAKVNGHGSSNGIRVTWFGINGVIKTTDPAGTYAEFTQNGGYLIAPEGAVAVNIPMWNNSDNNEIYILNRDHIYENGTCLGCGDHKGAVITQQPESVEQEIGKKFAITVKAESEGLTYQWYYKDAGMKSFGVSSNKTSSYAYTMQDYMHNRQVYCVITDAYGNQVTTETATITRPPQALKITQQPQDACTEIGEKFSIKPTVQGDGLTYQWYYKESYMKEFAVSSNKTSAYAYTMQSYMHNRQVYCVITDQYGATVITETVTITRPPVELKILAQPTDASAPVGTKFSVSFEVQGDGLTYQWYVKESGAKAFKVSSNKTSAYAYTMASYMNNRQVYCVITDQYGNQVTTEIVTIHVTK